MSGPIFSNEQDSSPYSTANILLVGIRGCIAPILGAALFYLTNSSTVLLFGSILCILSYQYLVRYSKQSLVLQK
jgi:hypothetical protein